MKQFISAVFLLLIVLPFSMIAQTSATPVYKSRLIVALDGSGDFKSIHEAVNAVRDLSDKRVVIYIKNGIYHEKLVIPSWKTNISLIGESLESTVITNDDFSGKPYPTGADAYGNLKMSTYTSYTVLVQGNDIHLENLTIQNTAGRVGQAVALHVEGDRIIVKHCKISGNQDTLYSARENSRQYYEDCFIEGTTDFIFGEAIAVFSRCTIKSLVNSFVTAASTRINQPFGFVFLNCRLVADTATKKVYLGRPWRPYAKTVFIHCELGSHIVEEGWNPWKGDAMFPDKEKTCYYAEYKNSGAGSSVLKRVEWSSQLTRNQAKKYTISNILSGKDQWQVASSEVK